MKKSTLLVILAIFISNSLMAQLSKITSTREEFGRFLESKTQVVYTGNEEIDAALEEAMNEYWDITKFEFIDVETFKENVSDASYSFLSFLDFKVEYTDITYSNFGIFMGGQTELTTSRLINYSWFDRRDSEKDITDAAYRINSMIKGMVQAININKTEKISGNMHKLNYKVFDVMNEHRGQIKSKTLLINKRYLNDKLTEDYIAKNYPYKYKIVSQEELEELVKSQDNSYCYLIKAFGDGVSITIYDNETGSILLIFTPGVGQHYTEYFEKKDIKQIVKKIDK